MTHSILKRQKTKTHKSLATSRWSKRWSMDSTLFLHKQHQSITMTCNFIRLFKVKIFPKATVQTKNTTLKRGLVSLNTLPRKRKDSMRATRMIKWSDLERLSFGRDPTFAILTTSTHFDSIQKIKEQSTHLHWVLLIPSNTKQHQESCLQGLVSYLKSYKSWKIPPPPLIVFPHPNPIGPKIDLKNHPPHMLSYLTSTTDLHKTSLSMA